MRHAVDYSLFYLTTPRNMEVLQVLTQTPSPISFETLQRKLKGKIESEVQLQKCLRRGETLGFIERQKGPQGNSQYSTTLHGERVLQKYLELLSLLKANEIRLEMCRS